MIPLSAGAIAAVVGGTVAGDPEAMVTAPAVLDGRLAETGGLFVAFAGENADGHDFAPQAGAAGAAAVLGSRPTSLTTIVVPDAAVALQRLAAHVVSRLRGPGLSIVGVTGSQGKTSTKDLVAAMLAATAPTVATLGNLNNELGAPATMLRAESGTRFLVLEMGARRIGDIARLTALAPPDVAIVLNVGKAHIGEFGSQEAIARGKGELVRGLAPGGTAVLNADDPRVASMPDLTDGPVVTFGRGEADIRVRDVRLDRVGRPTFELRTSDASVRVALPIVGAHQALNAAAAAAAGRALGVRLEVAAEAFATATLSPWRMEVRELPGGVLLLNDSYNSSPGSARSSLDALATVVGARRIAVLGPILELGDAGDAEHRAVGEYAALHADLVISVGDIARPIAEGAAGRGRALADNAAAIDWLRAETTAGDVVLVKASRGAHLDEVAEALR